MAEPISTTLTLLALRPILSEIAKNANLFFCNEFSKRWNLKNFSINNTQLIDSIEKIGLVKTLFTGAEKPVDLHSFFYRPSITTKNGTTKVYSLNDIVTEHSLLVEATVGQGKSIFLRYLALQEASINSRIPIFIELKNITKDKNLEYLIKEKIAAWTNNITDEQVKYILQSGKVSLFLDAFDETSKDYVTDTLSTIENLANNFSDLKLIVSSRPEHEIKFSNFFETIQVKPYDNEDQKNLIYILVNDPDARITLINSIDNSTPEIQELLTTPLMIGLYVKKFNSDFSPPENITSFYRNIFEVVATTHDRTKSGFIRKSSSGLTQEKLEKVFERFCFTCYKMDKTSFEKHEILELLDKNINKLSINQCNNYQVLEDFCSYLCLIIKDGTKYTFIHRSIFEYYVAFFFSKLSIANAEIIIPEIKNFSIIVFLKNLNKYYLNKFYLLKEFNLFIEKYFKNKRYNSKHTIPHDFLEIFYIKKNKEDLCLYRHTDFFSFNENHSYLDYYFLSPIALYISDKYFDKSGYHCQYPMAIDILKDETTKLYQKMNVDLDLKHKIELIFEARDECLNEIYQKENEISFNDFDM